jgi:hypothetical protein
MNEQEACLFCGSRRALRKVGIAIGMGGEDYAFCASCLKKMTADEFLRHIHERRGYVYPPRYKTEPDSQTGS